jgi:hypothetical protein
MITIGAASPYDLTGTEAGITKPFRLSLRFLSVWYSVLCTDILYRFDWDAAPFKIYCAVPETFVWLYRTAPRKSRDSEKI